MSTAKTVEACIVTYENEEYVEGCVRSLASLGSDVAVAVHDNSREPLALDVTRRTCSNLRMPLRVERCGANCGFARACNSLARGSDADLLLFLNPDAEILEWPTHLTDPAGIVGPMVIDSRGRLEFTSGKRRTIREEFLMRWLRFRPPVARGDGYVSGAALLVPRAIFNWLNGFDEHLFMYYEDIDLCARANAAGISISIDPAWKVRHVGAHAARHELGKRMIQSFESASYYYAKHGQNVAAYRQLCRIDVKLKLALFRLIPSRRASLPALRQLARHLDDRRPPAESTNSYPANHTTNARQ